MGKKIGLGFAYASLLFIAFWAFATHPDSRSGQHTERGARVIKNPKHPVPENGSRKRLEFKEDLSIGVREGDENYMFGEWVFFTVDDDGRFYVSDLRSKRLLKYERDGKFLQTIGSVGQGPGEFQFLSAPRLDKDGCLYITEVNSKISFFDRDGRYLRQTKVPGIYEDLFINSRGQYVAKFTRLSEKMNEFTLVTGLFDGGFNLLKSLCLEPQTIKPPEGQDSVSAAKFSAGILSMSAFRPVVRHVVSSDDRIFLGNPKEYALEVYSPEGEKLMSIARDYDPIPVEQEDKRYFIETRLQSYPESERGEIVKFLEFPKYKPAYLNFALMENGWLLVIVDSAPGKPTLFDLFDEAGVYVGQFEADLPPDEILFRNGKAYALAADGPYKVIKRLSFAVRDY